MVPRGFDWKVICDNGHIINAIEADLTLTFTLLTYTDTNQKSLQISLGSGWPNHKSNFENKRPFYLVIKDELLMIESSV